MAWAKIKVKNTKTERTDKEIEKAHWTIVETDFTLI